MEANRLAGLRIGSDVSAPHPLSSGSPKLDSKTFQPYASAPTVIKEYNNTSQPEKHEGNWGTGWQSDCSAQRNAAQSDARRGLPRIGLQRCNGSDIVSWLRMVDLHISSQKYSDEEWILEVPYYLEGGALALWWEVQERKIGENAVTWSSFKQELLDRFCPRSEIEVVSNLRHVKYKDDIRLYIQQFSETVMRGRRPAEDVLLSLFLFGLPPDYFMELTEGGLKRYETLSAAMYRAKEVFAPKEAAAVEYIERNPERAYLLHQSRDPVFLRTLTKLGIGANNKDAQRSRNQDQQRGQAFAGPDGPQQQVKGFSNMRPQRFQQRPNNAIHQNQEQNRDIERLLCKKCDGRGHDEQHCPLQMESNRRPGCYGSSSQP